MPDCPEAKAVCEVSVRRGAHADSPLMARLDTLEADHTLLARDLEQTHAELDLALEIMACVADRVGVEDIERTLLARYATLLHTGEIFLDSAGCCRQVPLSDATPEAQASTDQVRAVLGPVIEAVRRGRRALVVGVPSDQGTALAGVSALLATLPHPNGETAVVVALRAPDRHAFDADDVRASETALACGVQALHNAGAIHELQRTTVQTVWALVNAIDAKDNYTSDHSERVGGLARMTGEALGLPKPRLQALEWAGLLHDVGKIGVSEQILNKPGVLTASEALEMRRHPRIGYDVLRPVAQFASVLDAVLYHHENHDGSGYPEGRAGDDIPLEARIVHVVDIFDALTTVRPYRRAHDVEYALALLEREAGRVTDPEITRLFLQTLRHYMAKQPCEFRARFAQFSAPAAGVAV